MTPTDESAPHHTPHTGDVGAGGVLVAVDGSRHADRALAWAAREARARGNPLTIAHAYHWPRSGLGAVEAVPILMDAMAADSTRIVGNAVDTARSLAPEIPVAGVSRFGAAVPTLADLAAGMDLAVVGSRGLGGFTGMLLGSVGTGLAAHAPCPVAVIRGERTPSPDDPVVVGIDGAPPGDTALTHAFQAAERGSRHLLVVHCWQSPTANLRTTQGTRPTDADQSWQRSISDALEERVTHVGQRYPNVHTKAVIGQGRPARLLLENSATAQLVVVGTRGFGELKGLLMGSTSRALVQHAPCPVIIVR